MTLPASGPISLGNTTGDTTSISVNRELYRASPYQQNVSLGDAAVRTLFGVSSGAISLANGRGITNYFIFYLPYANDLDLRAQAVAAGWDQNKAVFAIVGSGVYIRSSNIYQAALYIGGSFPNGVRLQNNGAIIGCAGYNGSQGYTGVGGAGGFGGNSYTGAGYSGGPGGISGNGYAGTNGGTAVYANVPVTIDNLSGLYGGDPGYGGPAGVRSGGGGGGGSSLVYTVGGGKDSPGEPFWATGGQGGAGYGAQAGLGGQVGGPYGGTQGAAGTYGGTGGYSGSAGSPGQSKSYSGGPGGAGGIVGSAGANGSIGNYLYGSGNVTWVNYGYRQGGVV